MAFSSKFKSRRRKKRRGWARKKVCAFCANKNLVIDFKSPDSLRRYVSERGRIIPRRISGVCAKHQRKVASEIKRGRILGMLPFTTIDIV